MDYNNAVQKLKNLDMLGSRLGLGVMRELMGRLGNPQDGLKIVHVAGTNGKGSVIAFLDSIAFAAGVISGAYTSPALVDFKENIRVNGIQIDEPAAAKLLNKIFAAADEMVQDGFNRPTRFETETALAFLYFEAKQTEIVFLEAGLGGRDDATNIIKNPILTVLTSISLDHTKILGDTVEKIAEVKAGIIKAGVPLVTALQQTGVRRVIENVCAEKNAALICSENHLPLEEQAALMGYKADNALTAALAAEQLGFTKMQILHGLKTAKWFGRLSEIHQKPTVVVDGAHNEHAAKRLMESLTEKYACRKFIFIIGIFQDKDYQKMLQIVMPFAQKIILIDMPENKRLMRAEVLKTAAVQCHNAVYASRNPLDAVQYALAAASPADIIVAFGSLSIIKPVEEALIKLTSARQIMR